MKPTLKLLLNRIEAWCNDHAIVTEFGHGLLPDLEKGSKRTEWVLVYLVIQDPTIFDYGVEFAFDFIVCGPTELNAESTDADMESLKQVQSDLLQIIQDFAAEVKNGTSYFYKDGEPLFYFPDNSPIRALPFVEDYPQWVTGFNAQIRLQTADPLNQCDVPYTGAFDPPVDVPCEDAKPVVDTEGTALPDQTPEGENYVVADNFVQPSSLRSGIYTDQGVRTKETDGLSEGSPLFRTFIAAGSPLQAAMRAVTQLTQAPPMTGGGKGDGTVVFAREVHITPGVDETLDFCYSGVRINSEDGNQINDSEFALVGTITPELDGGGEFETGNYDITFSPISIPNARHVSDDFSEVGGFVLSGFAIPVLSGQDNVLPDFRAIIDGDTDNPVSIPHSDITYDGLSDLLTLSINGLMTAVQRTFPADGILTFDEWRIVSPELTLSANIAVTLTGSIVADSEWIVPVTPSGFSLTFSADYDVFGTQPTDERFILYMRHHSPSGKILVQFPEAAGATPVVSPTWQEEFDAALDGTKWPIQLTDTGSGVSRPINLSGDSSMGVDFNGVSASDADDNQLGSEALPSDNEFTLEVDFNIGAAASDSPQHQIYLADANTFAGTSQHIRLDNVSNPDRSLYNIRTNDGATQTDTATAIGIVANKRWAFQVNRTTGAVTIKYYDGAAWQTAHTANIGAVTDLYVFYRNGKLVSHTGGGQYFRSDFVRFYPGIIDPTV